MKRLLIFTAFCLLSYGCKMLSLASNKETLSHFNTVGNTITYNNEPFAKLQAVTYTIDNGDLIKEMNFKLVDKSHADQVENMIYYLAKKHSEEIEVELDVNADDDVKL